MQAESLSYHHLQQQAPPQAAQVGGQEYMDTSQATPTAVMTIQQQQQGAGEKREREGRGEREKGTHTMLFPEGGWAAHHRYCTHRLDDETTNNSA